jgi:hypothetical protein
VGNSGGVLGSKRGAYRRSPARQAFIDSVLAAGDGPECIEWTGTHRSFGYGQLQVDGKSTAAHRYLYELAFGPIPAGMKVCHSCDNPPCVRPSHLFLGTQKDNIRDCMTKGRFKPGWHGHPRGQFHPRASMTDDQVRAIRREYAAGGIKQKDLAAKYGIAQPTVSDYVRLRRGVIDSDDSVHSG